RLGSRVVTVSRRQASLDVAARALAPSEEALDAPLRPRRSLPVPGACYRTVRFLSGRDSHPLVRCSGNDLKIVRQDAPWTDSTTSGLDPEPAVRAYHATAMLLQDARVLTGGESPSD